jgi:DNA-binding NarL/FixJ family response regulator
MIQVIIAEDHHLVRQGIRAILEKTEDIEVIGEAEDGQEAVTLVEKLKPDVVVMDLAMPRLNGTQALEKIQALGLETKVVILSMYSDTIMVRQALKTGAKGYLLKRSVTEELLLAIRAATRGEIYLSPPVSKAFINDALILHTNQVTELDLLSPREREVMQLIAEGYTNNAIAQILKISSKTVEKHRTSIMTKLNIHDTAGLVRAAIKFGLVSLDA